MTSNEITGLVIDAGLEIHRALGPGLLESVYDAILGYELARRGLAYERQVPVPVLWKGLLIKESFRPDFIVEGKVLVELKSVEKCLPVHKKQVLTYLRATGLHLGLLMNFGEAVFRDGIERIINGELEDRVRQVPGEEGSHTEAQRRRGKRGEGLRGKREMERERDERSFDLF